MGARQPPPIDEHRIAVDVVASVYTDGIRKVRELFHSVLPISMALYVAGFCVCVLHYHRRGVPLSSLGHQQFIAAGVLYAVLTGVSFWLGAHSVVKGTWLGLLSVLGLSGIVLAELSWGVGRAAGVRTALYVGLFALAGWMMSAHAVRRVRQHITAQAQPTVPPARRADSGPPYDALILLWLMSAAAFGTWVFPTIPQWLGGGDARRTDVVLSSALSEEERGRLGMNEDHACWYEVLQDPDTFYLMAIERADERCTQSVNTWSSFASRSASEKSRFVALPRSRIGLTIYR